ncbi:MAG: apolipoprotein N-acyltransferase [Hyphomicrobium sp.]
MAAIDERAAGAKAANAGRAASGLTIVVADWIIECRGWQRHLVALVAGAVSVLAMAPFFLWPVLFITLPVLVWLIDAPDGSGRPLRAAATSGWFFGFGYFFAGLFWIGEAFLVEAEIFAWLLPFAITIMPAGLALFYAAAAAAARVWWPAGVARLLVLAVTFAMAEWLRGHVLTGFPWNVLGYALTPTLPLMQAAGVLGIYGLTLWTVVVGAGPLVLAADAERHCQRRRGLLAGLGMALVPLAASYAHGVIRLKDGPVMSQPHLNVRIVQPSVPQRDKWRPEKQGEIFRDHLYLSRRDATGAVDDLAGVSLLVWPEAAMPFLPLSTPEALTAIADLVPDGVHLVTGALRVEGRSAAPGSGARQRDAYNSLMVFDSAGRLAALYDKIHLVPFGEYLPFQTALESIGLQQLTRMRGGFAAGRSPRPLISIPGLPVFGGLICYEAIFPAAVVQDRERPQFLVNVTNDGWFGNTTGPRQHFHQSRIRAVEEGLPLVRAANNGISAVIDGQGRVLARLGLDRRGVVDHAIPPARPTTLYSSFGDAIFLLNALAFLLTAFLISRPRIMTKS